MKKACVALMIVTTLLSGCNGGSVTPRSIQDDDTDKTAVASPLENFDV